MGGLLCFVVLRVMRMLEFPFNNTLEVFVIYVKPCVSSVLGVFDFKESSP